MNTVLRKTILRMVAKDQKMRKSNKWNKSIDRENAKRLKKIIKKYGWPDFNLVGVDGSHGAWLLVQHADHDLEFQKKCLALMKEKAKQKKVHVQNIAFLTDRVKRNEGLPQIYGTQFSIDEHGKLEPWPIWNTHELNQRRKKYGLEPFEKYKARMTRKQDNPQTYKR